eukprot:GFUD01011052.1.p1 GENE.GFUD01011052.1~~GFUD01011052.1.p1  ORF type:complete len:158 (+),score=35.25 GFUD01011052.1:82-555(+)
METVFQPGICTFEVRRQSSGDKPQVKLKWSVEHDNEGCENSFSVSILCQDNLIGFAAYSNSTLINWSSSFSTSEFYLLDERGLKKQMVGKDCRIAADGQVSRMMGSAGEAERFLALLEKKILQIVEKPEIWNNSEGSKKKSPKEVWGEFKTLWLKYI